MIAGDHIENIIRYIGFLRNEVELRNHINLYDINIHLEYLLSDLLNIMYPYKLSNKNTIAKNATAIDLFDDTNRIAIQITSDNKSDKIKETLDKFYKQQYDKKYDKLIHLILTKKRDYTTPFETNSRNGNLFFKFEIKDTFDLITEIRAFNADKIATLASFLHRNLAYSLNWQPKIKEAIESLKNNTAFESLQKEIIAVELELDRLKIRQRILKTEISQIQNLPKTEEVTENDIEIIYNQFKQGLGTLIAKSIEQVKVFKDKIDQFQHTLINNKLKILNANLETIRNQIIVLEKQQAEKIKLIDTTGILKDLNTSLSIYDKKNEALSRIRTLMNDYENAEREKQVLEQKRGDLLLQLNTVLFKMTAFQESFQETILKIHELVMGNRKAAFTIQIQQKAKTSIEFEMRVDADGSHSVDRTKVFIYDMALMFNEFTEKRHPKCLIHDNIFDVDQDTLMQSLHFLLKQEDLYDNFQYILTLNKDKIENELNQHQISLTDGHFKAIFTKANKFLKQDYQEI